MGYSADILKKQYGKQCKKQRTENLLRLREEIAGLSATEFCKQIGIQKSNLSSLECGDRDLSLFNIQAYKTYFSEKHNLNISTDYLLGYTSVMENEKLNVSDELGLTGKSIEVLKKWKGYKDNPKKLFVSYGASDLDTLNLLLEDYYDLQAELDKKGLYANYSIFHFIGNYIFSERFRKCPTNNIKYRQKSNNPEIGDSLEYLKKDDIITVNGESATIVNTYDESNNRADSDGMTFYNIEDENEIYQVSFQNLLTAYNKENIEKIIDRIKNRLNKKESDD